MQTHEREESHHPQSATAMVVVLRFLDYMRAEKGASAHTLEAYERQCRMFIEWMGARLVSW